jgi:uncharacterized protein
MTHFDTVKESDPDIKRLVDDIAKFSKWIFLHHKNIQPRASKVIHDSVWGTHRYEAYEIALINTPLIQRLRQIHQTANTYLTYPSARHTRFEHTLGVTTQVSNLLKALSDKHSSSGKKHLLGEGLHRTLRLAAILHDCGHGPLSHTSEEIYGKFPVIQKLKKIDPFKDSGPGEILSYLIIESPSLQEVLTEITKNVDIDHGLMKNAIVGYRGRKEDAYKIDMLHGPFDADKIDYLFRDGHFSGLPLQIDLDRLWYALDINDIKGSKKLTIDWGGASSLEQILFSKMTLFPTVYHHHKVRACDCMFKGIIEYINGHQDEVELERNIDGEFIPIDFNNPAHFLYFTDYDFFDWNLAKKDDRLHSLLHNLIYRRLLKRAMVISRDTTKRECRHRIDDYQKYVAEPICVDDMDYYRWLAKEIWKEAGKPGLLEELWVDCPKDPSFNEASETWISPLGDNQEPMPITDFFNVDKYADQYKQRKWRSHVFCREEYLEKVSGAAMKVFKTEFQIEFKPLAFHLCHVTPPPSL